MQALATALLVLAALGSSVAPQLFVDRGACPGEGCRYGERWVARSRVELRAAPDPSSAIAATVSHGEPVSTVTGEVHTVPGRFVVRRPSGVFTPRDEILVLTYLGEGHFRIRHNGELKEADLGFSPWGGTSGTRCELDSRCWGTLERELEFSWWVKVLTYSGSLGWVLGSDSFDPPID